MVHRIDPDEFFESDLPDELVREGEDCPLRRGARTEIYQPVGRKIGRDIETDDKLPVWKKESAKSGRGGAARYPKSKRAADESRRGREIFAFPKFPPDGLSCLDTLFLSMAISR